MKAEFAGWKTWLRGRAAYLFVAAAGVGLFYFAAEDTSPPVSAPVPAGQKNVQFPPYRPVAPGNAVLLDPFAASSPKPLPGDSSAPQSVDQRTGVALKKTASREAAALQLVGVARKGARSAAVFLCGKETKICVAGDSVGLYRVVSLEEDGALLEGPDGVRRLRVGR